MSKKKKKKTGKRRKQPLPEVKEHCYREAAAVVAMTIPGDYGDALVHCSCKRCRAIDAFAATLPG
jgi:hypothetical protein